MLYPARNHIGRVFETLQTLLPEAESGKPQVIVLAGESVGYRHDTDRELLFRQESNFFYLTGCNVPSSLLICHSSPASDAPSVSATLFVPEANEADIMWSVPPPSISEAKQTHDFDDIKHCPPNFGHVLEKVVHDLKGAIVHILPREPTLFPKIPCVDITEKGLISTDAYLLAALQQTRLEKDAEEIKLIKQANAVSSRAHEVVMRVLGMAVKGKFNDRGSPNTPPLPGEWTIKKEAEAEALFVASCRREGAIHQAYLPIVAASTRASTLHYCCNDKEFAWGPVKPQDHRNTNELSHRSCSNGKEFNPQVLLIDAGCEWNNYASDITRTMPVGNGGKFANEAKAIYELVLEMQRESFAILKPGVHWKTVQLTCHRTLIKGFQKLGIFKSPESPNSGSWNSLEAILSTGESAAFFPHGVGHSLGLDVHDAPDASKPKVNDTVGNEEGGHESFYKYLRLMLPLRVGMVVTVEPGIYFSPHLLAAIRESNHVDHDTLRKYENVGGVRIEDVVVITGDGYENMTTVRSDVDWVEGVCSGEM